MILRDPVTVIADFLEKLFTQTLGIPAALASLLLTLIGVVIVASFGLLIVIFLIWLERKVSARIQDRLGPNRAGPFGLLQTFADIIKLFTKEDITPEGADIVIYNLAPILSVVSVLLMWAVIPFAITWFGTDINVAVLYIVAVGSLGTLSIIMAGWSSNNKYALLGAFRTVAQLVSYEIPLVLVLLVPVLLASDMGMNGIVNAQEPWFILLAPLAALIFLVASIAEVGRTPFDLLEAESEIVAGFHIEYSGMKFALFFAAEFLHAFTISALTATLFLGGWRGPLAGQIPILGVVYFMAKTFLTYFVVMWVRSTLPRVRIDHLLSYNWKFLTPLALALLIVTAIVEKLVAGSAPLVRTISHLGANLVLALITVQILQLYARRVRRRVPVAEPRPAAQAPAPEPSSTS